MCYWELRKRLTRSNEGENVVKDDKVSSSLFEFDVVSIACSFSKSPHPC
jgi:hypothetical protein